MSKPENPLSPLVIRFADGRQFHVAESATSDLLLNGVFLRFYVLAFLGWAMVGQPLPFLADAGGTELFLLWGAMAAGGLVWLYLVLGLVRIAHRVFGLRSVYTPLLTLPAVVIWPYLVEHIAALINLPFAASDGDWLAFLSRTAVFLIILDLCFGNYVARFHSGLQEIAPLTSAPLPPAPMPRSTPIFPDPNAELVLQHDDAIILAPHPPSMPKPDDPPASVTEPVSLGGEVLIGTESFAVSDLVLLRSDDHYINVVTRQRRVLVRGRLSDVLAQIPAGNGIQLNRSAWVSFSSISSVDGDDGKQPLVVKLVSGDEERVAQSRRHALVAAMSLRLANRG